MLVIVKTHNFFNRPKYKPNKVHNQFGVHDTEKRKTILRNVTHKDAIKYIAER